MSENYQDINAKTIDRWVENGWEWGTPITHEQYLAAKKGNWSIVLTPTKPVPQNWFPDLKGLDLLGLACAHDHGIVRGRASDTQWKDIGVPSSRAE